MPDKVVYFAKNMEDGLIKIGTSGNVENRISALCRPSKGVRCDVKLVAVAKGSLAKERAYHAMFSASRVFGEWFSPTDDIIKEIALLEKGLSSLPECKVGQDVDWIVHATPDELARIAELENMRFAHTREKTRIRNRCYARAKQDKEIFRAVVACIGGGL